MGLDGMKLFTGSYKGENKPVVNMDPAVAKAAVDVAHAAGQAGVRSSAEHDGCRHRHRGRRRRHGAHGRPVHRSTPEQLARFKQQGIALIPTLSLFSNSAADLRSSARLVTTSVNQLKAFSDNGGPVLFGTDVGFTTIYDTTLEYELMRRRYRNARCWRR